jgi:hypothetical protein
MKSDSIVQSLVDNKMKSSLDENEWCAIVNYMFSGPSRSPILSSIRSQLEADTNPTTKAQQLYEIQNENDKKGKLKICAQKFINVNINMNMNIEHLFVLICSYTFVCIVDFCFRFYLIFNFMFMSIIYLRLFRSFVRLMFRIQVV